MDLRKSVAAAGIAIFLLAASCAVPLRVLADGEQRMIGTLAKIVASSDGKSAEVTLKDIKTGKDVRIVVTNELTLDKFKYGKTVVGDQIRAKYEEEGGKNKCTYFKKVAGE